MRRPWAALTLSFATACSSDAVEWSEIVYAGAPRAPVESRPAMSPSPTGRCPGSLRTASAGGKSYAVWWQARPDSSVMLMASRSLADGVWLQRVTVDSVDRGIRGCSRFPASIAADSASGYVHVAWFSEPADGGGVFFAHSMDSGATFHAPVPIVYGRSLSRVSVAAYGDRVAVAYEDPNAVQPAIGIALSTTMGHIFEKRLQATSSNGRARQPVVRIAEDSIRLWWSEYSANPAVSATRPRYRAGKWS